MARIKSRGSISNSPIPLRNRSKGRSWFVFAAVVFLILLLWKFFKKKTKGVVSGSQTGLVITSDVAFHGKNNRGNILYSSSNDWKGQTGYNKRVINGKEYRYCNFDTQENGDRALSMLVSVHAKRNGFTDTDLAAKPDGVTGVGAIYSSYSGNPAVAQNFEILHRDMVEEYNYPTLLDSLCAAVIRYEGN